MQLGQKLINIIKNKKCVLTGSIIKNICSNHFGVTLEEMEGKSRKREIVKARQAAIYLMKYFTDYSLTKIGQYFSDRDHTTGVHTMKVVNNSIDCKDNYLYYDIQILEAACVMEEERILREREQAQTKYVSLLFNNSKTHHASNQL